MRYSVLVFLMLAIGFLFGCEVGHTMIMDCQLYDSGELKSASASASVNPQPFAQMKHLKKYAYQTQYFKNGRLIVLYATTVREEIPGFVGYETLESTKQ